eukprot:456335-Amphidinium_carterae.2
MSLCSAGLVDLEEVSQAVCVLCEIANARSLSVLLQVVQPIQKRAGSLICVAAMCSRKVSMTCLGDAPCSGWRYPCLSRW